MKLTKENIKEWKAILKQEMASQFDVEDYDETISDEEWLDMYEGETPQDAIDDEVSNWTD